MTVKSYIEDAYTTSFESTVVAIHQRKDHVAIELENTYFYPEGGGQPYDVGTIEGLQIVDVQIEDGCILHFTSMPTDSIKVGMQAMCEVDARRRKALMQQHTGQHILSSCAEKLFNANTVGFHIGDDYVTVDLDQKLTGADIDQLELEANNVVFNNLSVMAHYPSPEELGKMPLRKQPKVTENIRVIEVAGVDLTPCGGTHLKTTSEVGMIKIKRTEPYKTGVRIEFGCGYYALETAKKRNEIINQLMRLFSVRDEEIVNFCEQLLENQKNDRLSLHAMKEQFIKLQVQELLSPTDETLAEEVKVITLIENEMPMVDLRLKTSMICEHENMIVLAAATEGEKSHFVLSKSKNLTQSPDMGMLFKTYLAPLGIKGGGNAFVAQGGSTMYIQLEEALDLVEKQVQIVMESY